MKEKIHLKGCFISEAHTVWARRVLTLMPLRPCCFSRMFSGLRSQWMMRCRLRASRHCRMEWANFLTRGKLKPWNLLRLISSYRFILNSSNVMQMWLRKVKFSSMCTTFMVPLRSCLRRCSRMRISSWACRWKRFSFRTIFRARCCCSLWSYTLATCPKLPLPIIYKEHKKVGFMLLQKNETRDVTHLTDTRENYFM